MPFRPDPDEGPSRSDQRKFGDDRVTTGYCPDCGAEVFDDADVCPRCFAFLGGETLRTAPRRKGFFHAQWRMLVVILLIAGLLSSLLLYIVNRAGR